MCPSCSHLGRQHYCEPVAKHTRSPAQRMVMQNRRKSSKTPLVSSPSKQQPRTHSDAKSPSKDSNVELIDGLTKYATRLPRPSQTRDSATDSAWALWHTSLQKIITRLTVEPDLAITTWGWLESGQSSVSLKDATSAENDEWHMTVVNCGRVPKYWMGQHLVLCDKTMPPARRFT